MAKTKTPCGSCLDVQVFGQPEQRRLAHDVGGHHRGDPQTGPAGHVHDAPISPGEHARQDRLRTVTGLFRLTSSISHHSSGSVSANGPKGIARAALLTKVYVADASWTCAAMRSTSERLETSACTAIA